MHVPKHSKVRVYELGARNKHQHASRAKGEKRGGACIKNIAKCVHRNSKLECVNKKK